MPEFNLSRKEVLLNITLLLLIASLYQVTHFKPVHQFVNRSIITKSRVVADSGKGLLSKVGPPFRVTEVEEINAGGGRRKLVISRDGKKREYIIRSEIWREYMNLGGVGSLLGSPTSNEYTWFDGKRQDFERGHWLYWSEKTGVKMNYNPYGKISSAETTPQVPVFYQGKPVVEWADWSKDMYYITQDFGVNGHLGQDLAINGNANPGYEVRPVAAGKVVFSGWAGSDAWGYMVIIKHCLKNGRHYYSQYAHLYDFPEVLGGQQVHKGTILGYVGNTGKSTGPHLDIQIKEMLKLEESSNELISVSDIGMGYSENRVPFSGNINIDSQRQIIYYKPSYFIANFDNGSVLVGKRLKTE